jgi:anti-sigma regulatory factor (Ser/Thr protein kinase)
MNGRGRSTIHVNHIEVVALNMGRRPCRFSMCNGDRVRAAASRRTFRVPCSHDGRRSSMTPEGSSGASARVDRRLPVEPASVAQARLALDMFGGRVDGQRMDAARLLVSELMTNAVLHGPDAEGECDLALDHDGERLRVEVRDGGAGFVRPTEVRDIGGWGLMFVDRLSDRWGIAEGAPTSVWFEIDTPAAGVAG